MGALASLPARIKPYSVALVVRAILLVPASAAGDPAAAEALFREGRRLLEQGKTDEACEKLSASEAQDSSSGTLLNLGLCHEMQHKVATAWSDYVSAARLAREQGRLDRAAVAEKKTAELEPRLPYLTVIALAPAAGLEIVRGTQRLGPGALGTAIPLDPGTYVVAASAPGCRPWKTTIDVAEAESKVLQVPALEREAPPVESSVAAPAESVPQTVPPVKSAGEPLATGLAAHIEVPPARGGGAALGWVLGGVSVTALGVGTGFGVASLVSYHDASAQCPSHTGCDASAMSARSSAETKAWVSNIALGAGAVGMGVGAYLLLTRGGRRDEPATHLAMQTSPAAGVMRLTLERTF
jgi:hypothetical protein